MWGAASAISGSESGKRRCGERNGSVPKIAGDGSMKFQVSVIPFVIRKHLLNNCLRSPFGREGGVRNMRATASSSDLHSHDDDEARHPWTWSAGPLRFLADEGRPGYRIEPPPISAFSRSGKMEVTRSVEEASYRCLPLKTYFSKSTNGIPNIAP